MKLKPKVISVPIQVSGWVRVDAKRPDGSVREVLDWFPNLILNTGLDYLGSGNGYLGHCKVGDGTSTPVVTQTTLDSQKASTNTTFASDLNSASVAAPWYGFYRRFFEFAVGTAAGNLTELGFGPSSGPLFSRTLFKDGSGNPVTIVILSDEILQVTYEARQYAPETDAAFSGIVMEGVARSGVVRAAQASSGSAWSHINNNVSNGNSFGSSLSTYSGDLGSVTSVPTGLSGSSVSSATYGSYVPGSYFLDVTWAFSLSQGNAAGGVKSVAFNNSRGQYQANFTPVLDKTSAKTMSLTFRISWTRRP
jgi:hypothetical protein